MSTVFIFHGIGGNSEENWFPWLKSELEAHKHRVIVPNFPHPDTPALSEWLSHMEKYADSIDDTTIFIGHSLGGVFALRLLETMKESIKATFLVASVTGPGDGLDYAPLMTSFTAAPFDWKTIRKNSKEFYVLHADNDPYITLENAEKLATNLSVDIALIEGGGHLGASAGYTEFPALRDAILTLSHLRPLEADFGGQV